MGKVGAAACVLACSLFLGVSSNAAERKPEDFTIAMAGDIIYVRPSLKVLESSAAPLLQLLRNADASFGNFESSAFELRGFKGALQSEIEGPALVSSPEVVRELKSMGFDLLSHANNHAFDWGAEGVRATNQMLDRLGLAHAGSGISLADARKPAYFTSRGIKVALVAVTSTFPRVAAAADAFGPVASRAGVNGLQLQRTIMVSPTDVDALRVVASHTPPGSFPTVPSPAGEARLLGQTFKSNPAVGERMEYSYRMDDKDRSGILAAVAQAKQNSQFVLFSLHVHEPGNGENGSPDFVLALAHAAIDAGADAFIAHGPHQLRGIEIYKGRPIFLSLANFAIMQPSPDVNPQPLVIPPGSLFTQRAFFESVIAVARYRDGKLAEIRLRPFELASTGKLETHGLPQPVSAPAGRAIIERLQKLSQSYGTQIGFEDGEGVIHLQ